MKKVSVSNKKQACESLNSSIARTAPKNISFGNLYKGRAWAAIGTQNKAHFKSEIVQIIDRNCHVSLSLMQRLYESEKQVELINQSKKKRFF